MPWSSKHSLGAWRLSGRHARQRNHAAATGQVGIVRRDPMAMLPFIGYNIRDYLVLVRMRRKMTDCAAHLPGELVPEKRAGGIHVARVRREQRVLKWILDRAGGLRNRDAAGWMPRPTDFDLEGSTSRPSNSRRSALHRGFKAEMLGSRNFSEARRGNAKGMIFQRELLITGCDALHVIIRAARSQKLINERPAMRAFCFWLVLGTMSRSIRC